MTIADMTRHWRAIRSALVRHRNHIMAARSIRRTADEQERYREDLRNIITGPALATVPDDVLLDSEPLVRGASAEEEMQLLEKRILVALLPLSREEQAEILGMTRTPWWRFCRMYKDHLETP